MSAALAAAATWVLPWWFLGRPTTAEVARAAWHWLTPGWMAWGRFGLALVTAIAAAYVVMAVRHLRARGSQGTRHPRQWALLPTVLGAVALGLLLVGLGYVAITHTLHADASEPPTRIDVLKTALTAVAGVGGAVALVVAYRRQHDLEQGRFIERFGAATAQLGDSDPAVRIAGVYALASAADEAATDTRRQQCIDVLCGYVRLPYEPSWGASHHAEIVTAAKSPATAVVQTGRETTYHQKPRQNDREVRQTVLRVIAAHVRQDTNFAWSRYNFDFTGVIFEELSLQAATFNGDARFNNATFTGNTHFNNATFTGNTHFNNATFTGNTHFKDATFNRDTTFNSCTFAGDLHFEAATFSGNAQFQDIACAGDSLFTNTAFRRAAIFTSAKFTRNAVFTAAAFTGDAVFNGTAFDRNAFFNMAAFKGETKFNSAIIKQIAKFSKARFDLNAQFKETYFNGETHFHDTTFMRKVWFNNARFRGTVRFKNARFTQTAAIFDTVIFKDKETALLDAVFAAH